MKYLCSVLAAVLLLCGVGLAVGQDEKRSTPLTAEEVGVQIVDALKSRNVTTLLGFISETGISVGTDGPTIPAPVFGRLLRQKRGVYCDLMDGLCNHNAAKSTEDNSLRALLLRQPFKLSLHSMQGVSKPAVVVDVQKEANPHEILFSLVLVKEKDNWKLVNIDYV
jgi:hypothetical protein